MLSNSGLFGVVVSSQDRYNMGITGLLPLLKSITDPVHVSCYRGRRVGIDGYAWLHRGAHMCAMELALQESNTNMTNNHLNFVLSWLQMLVDYGILPVIVFDGANLPMKDKTENERSTRRVKERKVGMALYAEGQLTAAMKAFQRCVEIRAEMVHTLITLCKLTPSLKSVECIVAPYEADAQLAYLSHTNYIAAVISEDSDLLVFGCPRVLYKMDNRGYAEEIKLNNLGANTELSFLHWTHSQFQQMAIFAGCDYLPNLPGLAVKELIKLCR